MSSLDAYYRGGPKTTQEAFPPVCLRTHWDPTLLVNHVLPSMVLQQRLALDPRPATKICTAYFHTSAGDAPLINPPTLTTPEIPSALRGGFRSTQPTQPAHVYPPGGAASLGFPFKAYSSETESNILRLDEPLTKCAERRYIPVGGVPAKSMSTHALEGVSQTFGLSPLAMDVSKQAGCRNEDDQAAWDRSARLFFNPTRYDRTTMVPKNLKTAEARGALLC